MSAIQPVAAYSLRIPPGDVLVPATPGWVQMFRLTMAAIDPTEEPELEEANAQTKPRATLKVVRMDDEDLLDDDDDDYDLEDDDDEDEDEDEELNGGPSVKKSKKELQDDDDDDMDEDDDDDDDEEDEEDTAAAIAALKKAMKKGKGKAVSGEEDDSEDEDDEAIELDQTVLCTLDAEGHYQQPLDFVVAEGEKIFFKVSGAYTVHLTGNYVMPLDDDLEDDDEDDYDEAEDEELDALDALVDGDDESDELDDVDDPRVMEVDSDEDKAASKALPATKKESKKGKNKRPADSDEDDDAALDDLMAKSLKQDPIGEEKPKKLSKAEKRAAKKQKDNEGNAVESATPTTNGASDSDKKKVQFAKNLEQGPTPSKAETKKDDKPTSNGNAATVGKRTVQGVEIDDRKIGTGPAAKKGSKLEMRYIGKLKSNNKVFDSNKAGKPFSVKVGVGEVIKGWDVGLQGISAGGERRLIIPAKMAYGNKDLPGIPKNSDLVFDVKCLSVK